MDRKILFSNLEAELIRAKINKSELAAMVGISRGSLSSKLSGKTDFKLDDMQTIKARLETFTGENYTLDFLFKRDD